MIITRFFHILRSKSIEVTLCGVFLFWGAAVYASEALEEAQSLAAKGDFLNASVIASELGNSEGFAFAAASLAVYGYEMAAEPEKDKLFVTAITYAEKAVELDPNSSEAYLQVAHTLGRYAQTLGTMTALSEGYAERIREAIDRAIALDAQNYRAFLSLGAWHSEVIAAGFMAWLLYGADEDESLEAYSTALELAPNDNNVHFQYAVGLLKLDEDNLSEALAYLESAVSLPVGDAYGEIVRGKAKAMLEEINNR